MRSILLLTHEYAPHQGGVATYAAGMGRAASELGYDVTVACPNYGAKAGSKAQPAPYRVLRFPGSLFRPSRHLLPLALRVRRLEETGHYDVIHGVDFASQMALQLLSVWRLRTSPHFFTLHGSELGLYARHRRYRWLMGSMFRRAAHTVAVSRYTRSLIRRFAPQVDERLISVVYHGVGSEWLAPPKLSKLGWRARLGIDTDALVVLTVSRLVPEKGHRLVIEALGGLPAPMKSKVLYLVVGDGSDDYRTELLRAAADRGARLLLPGPQRDDMLRAYYDASDLFVLLTSPTAIAVESFGLVYIEAAARGLATIGTDAGGIPEAIANGETGVLVPVGDVSAARERIEELLANADLRQGMGRRGEERVRTHFTWARAARETYRTFTAVLEA